VGGNRSRGVVSLTCAHTGVGKSLYCEDSASSLLIGNNTAARLKLLLPPDNTSIASAYTLPVPPSCPAPGPPGSQQVPHSLRQRTGTLAALWSYPWTPHSHLWRWVCSANQHAADSSVFLAIGDSTAAWNIPAQPS
jgi:hypothetical protein